jgi:hypothetical protein
MADGHININTGVLADIASQLRTLHDDFQNSTNLTGHYAGSMGSGDVANALNDFASDWSKKRDELVSGLDTLSKTAQTGAETWDGLDQHLADALTKASQQSGGKS